MLTQDGTEHEVDTIIWAGVATDCCIAQSAFDGDRRGFRNIVPIQAVSASKRQAFLAGLTSMSKSAAEIVDLDQLLNEGTDAPALDPDAIDGVAGAWFDGQLRLLGSAQDSPDDLPSVLARLRD